MRSPLGVSGGCKSIIFKIEMKRQGEVGAG